MKGTVVVASYAAVVATLSFGWNVFSWLWGGGRPNVELLTGVDGPRVLLAWVPRDGRSVQTASTDEVEVMIVRVRNRGRAAITVTGWLIEFSGGAQDRPQKRHSGPNLPHKIDAGEMSDWMVRANEVRTSLAAFERVAPGKKVRLRAAVDLGNGKRHHSKWRWAP